MDHLFTNCMFCKFILTTGLDDIQVRDLGRGRQSRVGQVDGQEEQTEEAI